MMEKKKFCPIRMIAYPTEPAEQVCLQEECEWWTDINYSNWTEYGCSLKAIVSALEKLNVVVHKAEY